MAVPVTVKCRIGVDEQEPRGGSVRLVADASKAAGAAAVVVHARKAWLEGLSPKDNRDIPPLDYALVHALKRAHPDLADRDQRRPRRPRRRAGATRGGRRRHARPRRLSEAGTASVRRSGLFGEPAPVADAFEAIEAYMPYIARELGAASACTI